MRVARWRPDGGIVNYGDELNAYLWPKLLSPATSTVAPDGMIYGIGTVLTADLPPANPRIVLGAGLGYHRALPVLDSTWKVYFVRGPHTARALGGVPYITDPGILVSLYFSKDPIPTHSVSFMPRWDSVCSELEDGLKVAGIHFIDPRRPVELVMADIAATGLLLTEALHGAVCADALRVPWVSIYANRGHEYKWHDWCGAMGMVWNPIDAEEFSLRWAADYAVPQLSALSTHTTKLAAVKEAIMRFNNDIEAA